MNRLAAWTLLAASAAAQGGWVQRNPATQPPGRSFHALDYDWTRTRTVMFGGWNGSPLGDTWEWDGVDWTQRIVSPAPPGRCCHALSFDLTRGVVVVFGGTDGTPTDFNDTWEFDGTSWTQAQPPASPSPRREVRMAYDPVLGLTLLFGGGVGGSGNPVFDDTWVWDGQSWTELFPATRPPARWSHGMTHNIGSGRVVVFGGASASIVAVGDMWSWNGVAWTQVTTPSGPGPVTRTALGYDLVNDLTVSFGGQPTSSQTWVWNGSWVLDPRTTPAPSPRQSFALASDLFRGKIVLFGGGTSGSLADTWEYEADLAATWSPYGPGCASAAASPSLMAANRPLLGQTFDLTLAGLPPASALAAIALGTSDQAWAGGQLPASLAGFGMPGCQLLVSPDTLFFVPAAGGAASLPLALPADNSLIGVEFFAQGLAFEPGANAAGALVSNAGAATAGIF